MNVVCPACGKEWGPGTDLLPHYQDGTSKVVCNGVPTGDRYYVKVFYRKVWEDTRWFYDGAGGRLTAQKRQARVWSTLKEARSEAVRLQIDNDPVFGARVLRLFDMKVVYEWQRVNGRIADVPLTEKGKK